MILRAAGAVLALAGLALLMLCLASQRYAPEPHSKRAALAGHKAGLPVIDAGEAERQLAAIEQPVGTPQNLERINRIFASAIVRYWPRPQDTDREIVRSFRESWLTALLQRLELWMPGTPRELSLYERRDYHTALAKGVGICSQAALAMADYLNRNGVATRIAGLDGHVVAVAESGGRSYVLDADYGVVLPMTMGEAESDPVRVREAYEARGYPRASAERVASLFGPAGNKVVAPGDYMATAAWRIRLLELAACFVPAILVALGAAMLLLPHSHSSVSTRAPSATR